MKFRKAVCCSLIVGAVLLTVGCSSVLPDFNLSGIEGSDSVGEGSQGSVNSSEGSRGTDSNTQSKDNSGNQGSNNEGGYQPKFEISDDFTEAYYKQIKVEISSPSGGTEGETAYAEVKLTLPDLPNIYKNHKDEFLNASSEKEIRGLILKYSDESVLDYNVTEEVIMDNGAWRLNSTKQTDLIVANTVNDYIGAVIDDIAANGSEIEINDDAMQDLISKLKEGNRQ